MMPFGARVGEVAVDLADDQRHLGIHAPRRRVVDHGDAGGGELRCQHLGRAGAGGEQGDVEARRVGQLGVLDDDLGVLPRQRRAGRPRRGEETDLVDREVTLRQQPAHDAADLTGCTDDTYTHAERLDMRWIGRSALTIRSVPAIQSSGVRPGQHHGDAWRSATSGAC